MTATELQERQIRTESETMPQRRSAIDHFWDKHLGTLIFCGVLVATQIGIFSVLQNKVSILETRQSEYVYKGQFDDLVRRTAFLESELVPRSEHILRDEQLNTRLKNIEESVHSIDDRLNQLQRDGKR